MSLLSPDLSIAISTHGNPHARFLLLQDPSASSWGGHILPWAHFWQIRLVSCKGSGDLIHGRRIVKAVLVVALIHCHWHWVSVLIQEILREVGSVVGGPGDVVIQCLRPLLLLRA